MVSVFGYIYFRVFVSESSAIESEMVVKSLKLRQINCSKITEVFNLKICPSIAIKTISVNYERIQNDDSIRNIRLVSAQFY